MLLENPEYAAVIHSQILRNLDARGIQDFYPPQWKAIQKGLQHRNLVVSIPTASGKTLIAEVCAFDLLIRNREQNIKSKIIYLCPLKALASEKLKEFTQAWENDGFRVGLLISDPDVPDFSVFRNDLIIMTNEKADAPLRMNPKLIQQINMIICDEIHLINDELTGNYLRVFVNAITNIKSGNSNYWIIRDYSECQ